MHIHTYICKLDHMITEVEKSQDLHLASQKLSKANSVVVLF